MDSKKYDRSVSLICPTCGKSSFEHDDTNTESPIKCTSCGREFSRAELIAENGENISINVDEIKSEVLKDFKKEISDIFKSFKKR